MSTLLEPKPRHAHAAVGLLTRPAHRGGCVAVALATFLAVAVVLLFLIWNPVDQSNTNVSGTTIGSASLAPVKQQNLSAQTQVSGKLGFAGAYTVIGQAPGIVTWLPAIGQVVKQGEVLYRVDGEPVVLLYGDTPAYRDLTAGALASDVTGADVRQLNAALVSLGYADSADLDPASDQFDWETTQAVKKLQATLGLEQTGSLKLGQVVFLPSAIRITELQASLGAPLPPGGTVAKATSTTPLVTVNLSPSLQSRVKKGDAVSITMPNLTTAKGAVSSVGTVAQSSSPDGAGGSATIPVQITLDDPSAAAGLDEAPVLVSITTATADDALTVPVTALLALAGGGYAVEVVDASQVHHLVAVTPGLFDDGAGLVQVTGDLKPGEQVVVPSA